MTAGAPHAARHGTWHSGLQREVAPGVTPERTSVCILGAAGDTTNLGVDALLESTIIGLRRALPGVELTVFDNGAGLRPGSIDTPDGAIGFDRLGMWSSRRIHRTESLANMAVSARFGFPSNPGVRRLREADAVVDLSGGDSFSDIYGRRRFDAISRQKAVTLRIGTPLVLLPQTYGPFEEDRSRTVAARLVRRAAAAWARDAVSFESLRTLLDGGFDERRHRLGVDVAFALPSRPPPRLDRRVAAWLDGDVPVFGLNVSGLLANDERSDQAFGLRENYAGAVRRVVRRILDETDARVLLVPHVLSDLWVVESDVAACRRFASEFDAHDRDRVAVLEDVDRAQEVKWVIGRCDAFCGTRMHSTIAALSTLTPALAMAYSPKTRGVFESCGQGHRVVDLRTDDIASIERQVMTLWSDRESIVDELRTLVPPVVTRAVLPFAQLPALVGSAAR